MDLADLEIDHAARTCRLRVRPSEPKVGRPSKLTATQVQQGRYLYWTGKRSGNQIAADWGVHRAHASIVLNFKSHTWV